MRCLGEVVERLDAELASLARGESALRLRLGQVLEVLSRGAHFELGFSSLAAYVLERCDRSVRWADAARCIARRVERLPELRRAMAEGRVSWSMGELLARVAQPEDEAGWIECAESRTVRQVRVLVVEAMSRAREAPGAEVKEHAARQVEPKTEPVVCGIDEEGECDDEMCTLTCTVDQEDAWLFEATRALLGQLGVQGSDAQCEALLAEAQGTLLAALPEGALDGERCEWQETDQQRWLRKLARWRVQAEALCEERIRSSLPGSGELELVRGVVALAAADGLTSLEGAGGAELDANVRRLASALARHELELARRLLRFHRADGWRRLGYATETQYARERLGLSKSSALAKRALALRLERLPCVAAALEVGQIGIEAAVQLVRVATPRTEAAWVERARRRTIKHLREEVAAALTAVRLSGEADCPPPEVGELSAFHELEQAVVSGRACQLRAASDSDVVRAVADARKAGSGGLEEHPSAERRAWREMLGSLARWLEGGLQPSASQPSAAQLSAARGKAPRSSSGRIQLRLRMSRATYAWWRGLEAQARRWLPCGTSWLRFLCLASWQAWRHLLGADVAYGQVYIRDRFRCSSPVCSRRDVTPHHLRFRSAGGSDDDDNVAAVCSWCHLQGVHGGRIRARGTARDIRWELGALGDPCLVVQGRERVAA